jgi:hypothetical protein
MELHLFRLPTCSICATFDGSGSVHTVLHENFLGEVLFLAPLGVLGVLYKRKKSSVSSSVCDLVSGR